MKTRVKTTFTVILVPSGFEKKTIMSDYNMCMYGETREKLTRFSFYSHLLFRYESGLCSQVVRHSNILMKKEVILDSQQYIPDYHLSYFTYIFITVSLLHYLIFSSIIQYFICVKSARHEKSPKSVGL